MIDFHTHTFKPDARHCVVNFLPSQFVSATALPPHCSVGIHPWWIEEIDLEQEFELMGQILSGKDSRVVALGEMGLDRRCGVDFELQRRVFCRQLEMNASARLPVILHVVHAADDVARIIKPTALDVVYIFHGFRLKPAEYTRLSGSGFAFFSIGEKFNAETVRLIPDDRLLVESDSSSLPLTEIYERIAAARGEDVHSLVAGQEENWRRIFGER